MDSTDSEQNGWAATEAGKHLQTRLNEERTVQAIDRLLDRIEALEVAVDKLTVAMEQAPGMIAMVADMADDGYRQAADSGVDLEQRLSNALSIAEKLTAPTMVEKLNTLLQFAEQAPGIMSMTMDMADEAYRKAAQNGVDIEQRLGVALQMAERLTSPELAEKLDSLLTLADQAPGLIAMGGDVFDEEMRKAVEKGIDVQTLIETVLQISTAISQANEMPAAKVGGIFSMLRTMRDPDRQKSIGYIMNVAKAYGKQLP